MFKKILIFFIICLIFSRSVFGQDASQIISEKEKIIVEYQNKLDNLGKQKDTLANQLKYIEFQTNLTELKISQTEDSIRTLKLEINGLVIQINDLDIELNKLSTLYLSQIKENYKLEKRVPKFLFIIQNNFNNFLSQYKYATIVQKNSQTTLLKMETTRTNFDIQKTEKEKKQLELEDLEKKLSEQKNNLANQEQDKNSLLAITKNDEEKYKKLKEDAENELNSLVTAAFIGKRVVKKGDILGIMGDTGYSFGAHLHFGLYNLSENQISQWKYTNDIDSLDYLSKNIWPIKGLTLPSDINKECNEDYRMSTLSNSPINTKLGSITQCRGRTRYSRAMYSNNFHNGIDLVSSKTVIYAINDGVAYFFRNPKSSLGNHVKLFHPDGKMTLYLHMQ